jgi:phosphoribosylaminoimidazole-succinocarboxamide synthase
MIFTKGDLLYEGKAKKIFRVNESQNLVWQEFKDSFTAFNGEKKATMQGKGKLNCQIATHIFKLLAGKDVPSHFIESPSENEMVTTRLEMIDLEVVVRNILAGSTAKKFQIEEGTPLEQPLVEFYYKKDELNDPFISDAQALMLKTVRKDQDLQILKSLALQVNDVLKKMFSQAGIDLVDFKIEFGYSQEGEILLGDEISPDSCRLWDQKTKEKMDKDRFRRDLGSVLEMYEEVFNRLTKKDV